MAHDPVTRLILELARLPGIGQRTAGRLAFHILRHSQGQGPTLATDLSRALTDVAEQVGLCQHCQAFCAGPVCSICQDARRDAHQLCVVSSVQDQRAIEQTGAFRGVYFILHGALSPLDGLGPAELRLDALPTRVERDHIDEVILATNTDVDGDATALYVAQLLADAPVRVTRLASGVPIGGELEYLDAATLQRALVGRRELH